MEKKLSIFTFYAQAVSPNGTSIAFACKGSELSVWDIGEGKRTYLAKGAKPNRIGLMDKPWNTAIAYIPGGAQIVVGTGQHKIRLYEFGQRRPKLSVDFGEGRITAVASHGNAHAVQAIFLP